MRLLLEHKELFLWLLSLCWLSRVELLRVKESSCRWSLLKLRSLLLWLLRLRRLRLRLKYDFCWESQIGKLIA